ncbi:hypothetical protein [Micromonospora matsumotoense]|uniref:hypothetical protein n=1 Tax=Micromonospora matsumotoense TaxID=121616 RepID=UPI003403B130
MAWYSNKALTNFRTAVNEKYPKRDKTSDGTIGDEAHQGTNSDHNPDPDGSVDAWDMDVDLRSTDDAAAIEELKKVFQAHESSQYWIHNRKIANRSDGWVRRDYTGKNPHDKHVHWNTRESHEDSNKPWNIKGVDDMFEQEDRDKLNVVHRELTRLHGAFPIGQAYLRLAVGKDDAEGAKPVTHPSLKSLGEALTALKADVAAIKAAPVGSVVITDEQLERVLRKVIGSVDTV